MQTFEDHFSKMAQSYALNRPQYPGELFTYLASIAPKHELAWDCGTGSGQAAVQLAQYFNRVVATDGSAEQIAQAAQYERVEYRVEPAEQPSLETGSVDLITAGLAIHWFNLDRFYEEARRVLVSGGVLAAWGYHLPIINPEISPLLVKYYQEILAGYWPERFRYVDKHYQNLPFPLQEIEPPVFYVRAEWDLLQFLGFVNTWSATSRYIQARGENPMKSIWPELVEAWGGVEHKREVRWELYMRIGKFTG